MTNFLNPYGESEIPNDDKTTVPSPRNSLAFRMFIFSIMWVAVCTVTFLVLFILEGAGILQVLTIIYSLEFSIVAGLPIGIILVVQSTKSLRQIKQQKQGGRSYAITAITLGYLISLIGLASLGIVSFVFMKLNGVI